MVDLLDEILLSENVVERFFKEYSNEDFKNWLLSILPEIEDCKNLKRDNPWHIYNCLEHILYSVESMNKKTVNMEYGKRKLLAYTMFLHDIGKPQCLIRRYSKLYKREVDSFFNHNVKSEEVANRVLGEFNFSLKEQTTIKKLILEHDMFMFLTLENDNNRFHQILSEKYVLNKLSEFDGVVSLNDLILVGRSDNEAQNPKMTKDSLKLLDIMEKMVNKLVNKKSVR
jgi:tRNA nucleotidyltransferase (CCA-adding enzyme)